MNNSNQPHQEIKIEGLDESEFVFGDVSINFDSMKDNKELMLKFILSLDNFKLKISVSPGTKDETKLFGYQWDSSIKPALNKEVTK
jgi:hypothetical protein